jgi:hypothetical protein
VAYSSYDHQLQRPDARNIQRSNTKRFSIRIKTTGGSKLTSKSNRRTGTFHIIIRPFGCYGGQLVDRHFRPPPRTSIPPHIYSARVSPHLSNAPGGFQNFFGWSVKRRRKLGKNRKEKVTEWKNIISMQLVGNPIDFYSFPWG